MGEEAGWRDRWHLATWGVQVVCAGACVYLGPPVAPEDWNAATLMYLPRAAPDDGDAAAARPSSVDGQPKVG
jgi:hypothetical protein